MSDFNFFDGIQVDDELKTVPVRQAVKTFICMSCTGTGEFVSPRGNVRGVCFVCAGKGRHPKPHFEVVREKNQRREKIAANKQERRHAFQEANPELFRFMAECTWSSFIQDMFAIVADGRKLTDNQFAAVQRTFEKTKARQAEKQQTRIADQVARSTVVDLSTIHAMFDKARENGLKKLAYRAEGLVLSPAKAASANAGGIYVKTREGTYLGKVMGSRFMATYEATDEQKAALNTIAANPAEAAEKYGRRTGECSCCGRELTDKNSIARGIGPICVEKWGF